MAAPALAEKVRLSEIFSELFILATHLRNARDCGNPDVLRRRLIEMFDAAHRKGKNLQIPEEHLQHSRYVMAAFLDEMILSSPWPEKDRWSASPLQYEFFGEHIAGVEFF